jgi:hypothetical protein
MERFVSTSGNVKSTLRVRVSTLRVRVSTLCVRFSTLRVRVARAGFNPARNYLLWVAVLFHSTKTNFVETTTS